MRQFLFCLAVAAFCLLPARRASAGPILATSGGYDFSATPAATMGWAFETGASPLTVVALDDYMPNFSSTQVRLYDDSLNILASATVSNTDPAETAGLTWYSHAITPITLAANTKYYIAADLQLGYYTRDETSYPSLTNGVTYLGGVDEYGTGLTPTSDVNGGGFSPGYFGPNFDVGSPLSTVPEPSGFTLAGIAFAALFGYAWRRRKRPAT